MALDDHIRMLSGVRLFEGFTQEQLRLLAFGAEAMRLPSGKKLYREDDDADSAYIVIRGRIGLFREHEDQHVEVSSAGPGAVLGEMALIADSRRLTSAEALTDADVLRINRSMFRRILEEYPGAAESLRAQIVEDLQAMIRRIEEVGDRLRNDP
ncbi:MAG: cyclic nucleotide-binding domain-containing protein [Hyphomicrobiales bacterium]|nr:cyclic nucleotide-binding domain-containing protein [Hyphomicrobiales bacterium]